MKKEEAELEVEKGELDGHPLLRLRGVVDFRTSPRLRTPLRRWVKEGVKTAIINLKELDSIDTTGMATIAEAMSDLQPRDGTIVLVYENQAVRRALELSDMEDCCPQCTTEDEAARLLEDSGQEGSGEGPGASNVYRTFSDTSSGTFPCSAAH